MDVKSCYLAAEGLESALEKELGQWKNKIGRLYLDDQPIKPTYWAQNIWINPKIISITSIQNAVNQLRSIQPYWALYPELHYRRSLLIDELLSKKVKQPLAFPGPLLKHPVGSWTLLEKDSMLISSECSSPFPNGEALFVEERNAPPSRAYLKLWEALARGQKWPNSTDCCLDLGSSPGSWTWALTRLGSQVISIDRAELRQDLLSHPLVNFQKGNAFQTKPEDFPSVSWVFCDVICYPSKLWEWLQNWLKQRPDINYVCTLKFQGEEHYPYIKHFESIPGSQIVHLYNNKHELTWIKLS